MHGVFCIPVWILKAAALMSSKRRYWGFGAALNSLTRLVLGGSVSLTSGAPAAAAAAWKALASPLRRCSSPKSFSRSGSIRLGPHPAAPLLRTPKGKEPPQWWGPRRSSSLPQENGALVPSPPCP